MVSTMTDKATASRLKVVSADTTQVLCRWMKRQTVTKTVYWWHTSWPSHKFWPRICFLQMCNYQSRCRRLVQNHWHFLDRGWSEMDWQEMFGKQAGGRHHCHCQPHQEAEIIHHQPAAEHRDVWKHVIQKHYHMLLQNTSGSESSVRHQQLTLALQRRNTSLMSHLSQQWGFQAKTLAAFWIGVGNDPPLSNPAEPLS